MKKFLLAVSCNVLFLQILLAQSEVEKQIKLEIWGQPAAEFKATQVPEKWKNESAVMLAFERKYVGDFTTKVTGLVNVNRYYIEKLNIHYRIKLLDKAAVQDFSEISFNNKTIRTNLFGKASAYRILGIKVIKPSGSEKEVDLKTAVKADAGSEKELKIPIPNLEPGDIVDYFIALRDEDISMPNFGDEETMEGKYPIVKQTISFTMPYQINFYSYQYNGAPTFVKAVKDKDVSYTLKDEMREKMPSLLWDFPYQSAPHYRYKITDSEDKPDSKKSAEKILRVFDNNVSNIGFLDDFIDGNFKKEKDKQKIVQELYYVLRNPIYKQAYYNIKQGTPLSSSYTPDMFFFLVDRYLSRNDIGYEILLVPSREVGPMQNLVNFTSCDIMIKVNTTPPVYLPRPYAFTIPNEVPYLFEGMEAVSRPLSTKNKLLPVSTHEQNSTTVKASVALDTEDKTRLQIKRSVSASGHSKDFHQYMVVTDYDYLKEYDQPKYQVEKSHLLRDLIKDYNKEKKKFEQRLTQDYNERDARIKNELESEMEMKISEYKNLTLKSIGMWHTSPNTEYTDEMVVENLTKKAGPNMIIELGKLIEKQTELKEDQKTRTRDIYMGYARSFTHEITFAIPEGYTVEGLENFNKKAMSDAGGFESAATTDGKHVVIISRKHYAKNHYSVTDWQKLVSFLDTAVDFYNAKLLLKKL